MTEIYKKIRAELFKNGADNDLDTALRIMQLERMDNLADTLDRIATALENQEIEIHGIYKSLESCLAYMPQDKTGIRVYGNIHTD